MRLIHTSDWHLGRTLHGADLLDYQTAFLDWLLDAAISQRADAVVVAGDIYDRAVPPTDAVATLDRALRAFARAGIPMVLTSGNHDSAIRLGFAGSLAELGGVHFRTSVADLARPVVLTDEHGPVAVYGIPYLLPDAVMDDLDAERSHASVLAAATALIRKDAAGRGIGRVVAAAHAFVTGALPSESERDLRVGGIGDAPASVFAGLNYVALGHLHGQQEVASPDPKTRLRYCGSPLAFSFSERYHHKSVTIVDLDADGAVSTTLLPVPAPRPLHQLTGRLDELLASGESGLEEAWLKVVLTDQVRPPSPMERLRQRWPHTLVLEFAPEGGQADAGAEVTKVAATADPAEICARFVEYTGGGAPDDDQRAVLREVIEAVQHAEDAALDAAGTRAAAA